MMIWIKYNLQCILYIVYYISLQNKQHCKKKLSKLLKNF